TMLRLLRFTASKYVARPASSNGGPHERVSSPVRGRSTLITSAPRSPRTIVAKGPASTREKSRIFTLSSAAGIANRLSEMAGSRLCVLEQEGQVVYLPRRGYFVTELRIEDLTEIYELRRLLEARAARKALPML